MRLALGLSYRGTAYHGWQSQPDGLTVQDRVEHALSQFAAASVRTICAGRTDAGVHALNQVVHLDTDIRREPFSWVRGSNRFLPDDIAFQWCQPVGDDFHARNAARGRRYVYLLLESPVRPAVERGMAGWVFRPLDGATMREAAAALIGEHDFSAFRSSHCQALSPVKLLRRIDIERRAAYWRFEFEASAFLHHMVRNLMGCLVAVGAGSQTPGWLADVLRSRDRRAAAPTFAPDGLYFAGPYYDARHTIPERTAAMDWLPLTVCSMQQRTRIKICGLTREADVRAAVDAGADAVGFVFYAKSPRHVSFERAAELAAGLPPFVTPVGLFVNAGRADIDAALCAFPGLLLQFHGDETPADCRAAARPYLRAARIAAGFDLLDFAARFSDAQGLLLDAHVDGYGGGGKVFDWSLVPRGGLRCPLVLSGGLNAANVMAGMAQVRPTAVDVSSGVETAKGIKDADAIRRFCDAVREADARIAGGLTHTTA